MRMNKILLNNVLKAAWIVCAWLCATCALAQERVYVKGDLTFEPGSSDVKYFTIAMENATTDYVAFQMSIVLPEGLELAYNNSGNPRIFIAKPGVYPYSVDYDEEDNEVKTYSHDVSYSITSKSINVVVASLKNEKFIKRTGDLLKVYVKASPYLKPGDIQVGLNNVVFSDIDLNGPEYDSFEPSTIGTASSTSTLTLKVSASNKFSTCILPFDAQLPAGLEAYSCEATDGNNLVLTLQSSMQAFTPYIVYAPSGFDGTLTGTVDATQYQATVTNGYLSGTVVKTEVTGDAENYVLQNQGEGPMFYRVGDTSFAIPAGKCWLTLPASLQGVAAFQLHRPTGIETIPVSTLNANTLYDLSGRRIAQPAKGVYIVGGKKVVK